MKHNVGKTATEFEKLYFDNFSILCRSIYRFVQDEEIAKDIVQEVFLKYWQKSESMWLQESPKAYLHKACINQALNYLKEKERRDIREIFFAKQKSDSYKGDERPDIKYSIKETSANIQKGIDSLTPACRTAFLLSRYEQKSYKEIAAILDISVNTVEKHIGKALKKLRKILS